MAKDMKAKMTAHIEASMVVVEAKMDKMCRTRLKGKEPLLKDEKEEAEDLDEMMK